MAGTGQAVYSPAHGQIDQQAYINSPFGTCISPGGTTRHVVNMNHHPEQTDQSVAMLQTQLANLQARFDS